MDDRRTCGGGAARKALRIAKLHIAATDSVMMLVAMRIINRNAGDYRVPRPLLVITPSRALIMDTMVTNTLTWPHVHPGLYACVGLGKKKHI